MFVREIGGGDQRGKGEGEGMRETHSGEKMVFSKSEDIFLNIHPINKMF